MTDLLERLMKVVSKRIDHDWMKLYRCLPFYPPRGQANIEADIDEVSRQQYRSTADVHAMTCLQRWRRLNCRASVTELRQALVTCKRKDIALVLDNVINPRPKSKPKPKPVVRHSKMRHRMLWSLPRLFVTRVN